MFKLHAVQAEFGDSLIVQYTDDGRDKFLLIDGGPPEIYRTRLKSALRTVAGNHLQRVILSHVDNDHIIGLLDLLAEIRSEVDAGNPAPVEIGGVWHNSFSRTVDRDGTLAPRMQSLLLTARSQGAEETAAGILGIAEGGRLRTLCKTLRLPLNVGFTDDLICADTAEPLELGSLRLRVVGPTQANLDELQKEWEKWLDAHEDAIGREPHALSNADVSKPNLSSICLHLEENGKTMLLTGDARSDHVLQGLGMAGLLTDGKLHLNVLKVMHHGSDRNVTKTFFRKITADTYVISANGKNNNPDLATLIWLVEAAAEQEREIEIVATNRTASLDKLKDEYPPADYGYKLRILPRSKDFITIE
jgi:hypothetical protein